MSRFVQFTDVSVHYGTGASAVRALERANLGFGQGDFVCVVGPSGCGKTTMMQTLAGFLKPTAGEVSVDGAVVTGPGPERGVVFQQPTLFPWLTVAANAGFGPRLAGHGKAAEARVEQWLRTTGLWEFRDRYPYELSGGMQQRLAIARALCNEPKVLLMDEPFGALDAMTKESLQDELLAVHRRTDMSVVFITHDIDEAVYLGDRVVVLSGPPGRVHQEISIGLERPRQQLATRQSEEFLSLRARIYSAIHKSKAAS